MKKLAYIFIGITLMFVGTVYALPYYSSQQSLIPFVTDKYYLGTTTPTTNEWNGITTKNLTITGTCTGCGTGGGSTGGGVGWATTTPSNESIYSYGLGYVGIGTSTPRYLLQLSSSTAPQLALGDGFNPQWTFRNAGGNLYIGTTSPTTFATSSDSAFAILSNGNILLSPTGSPTTFKTISIADQTVTDRTGQYLKIIGGAGNGAGSGGRVSINAGIAGVTGSGNNVIILASDAGASGNGNGGSLTFTAGDGAGNGTGGGASFKAGNGGASGGSGGNLTLTAGSGGGGNSAGSDLIIRSGNGTGNGSSGRVDIKGSSNGSTGGNIESLEIVGGDGASGSAVTGGLVHIKGGTGDGAGNGGDVRIQGGDTSGGVTGGIKLLNSSNLAAILDVSSIVSTDKTFTFPNTTGTLCLTTTCLGSYDAWTHPASGVSATTSNILISPDNTSYGFLTGGQLLELTQNSNTVTQQVIVNKNSGGAVNTGYTLGNANTVNNANPYLGSFYSGIYMAGSGFNTYPGLLPNDSVYVNSDGNLRFAALSSNVASSTMTWSVGPGFSTANYDMTLKAQSSGRGFLGIGTTSPMALLSIQRATSTQPLFAIASSTATGETNPVLEVDFNSHHIVSGPKPTVSVCGSSPSVTGNDVAGQVTTGTALPLSCTVTFAKTYGTAPACVVTGAPPSGGSNVGSIVSSTTATSFSFMNKATTTAVAWTGMTSFVVSYYCLGLN